MLGRIGRVLAPEVVDQTVDRDRLAEMEGEVGEERAHLGAAELEQLTVSIDLERSEETNVESPWVGYLRLPSSPPTAWQPPSSLPRPP